MKASCLGKTLGMWRVWPAHQDVLKKWSSYVPFFSFSPFFLLEWKSHLALLWNIALPFLLIQTNCPSSCWFGNHGIHHSGFEAQLEPCASSSGTFVCRSDATCPSLLYSSILRCTCCTLLSGNCVSVPFCCLWSNDLLLCWSDSSAFPCHDCPPTLYLFHCFVWSFISDRFSFP